MQTRKCLCFRFAFLSESRFTVIPRISPLATLHLSILLTICCHFRCVCVCCAIFACIFFAITSFQITVKCVVIMFCSISVCPTYSLELPFWPCALCLLLFAFDFYSLVLSHDYMCIHTYISVHTYLSLCVLEKSAFAPHVYNMRFRSTYLPYFYYCVVKYI